MSSLQHTMSSFEFAALSSLAALDPRAFRDVCAAVGHQLRCARQLGRTSVASSKPSSELDTVAKCFKSLWIALGSENSKVLGDPSNVTLLVELWPELCSTIIEYLRSFVAEASKTSDLQDSLATSNTLSLLHLLSENNRLLCLMVQSLDLISCLTEVSVYLLLSEIRSPSEYLLTMQILMKGGCSDEKTDGEVKATIRKALDGMGSCVHYDGSISNHPSDGASRHVRLRYLHHYSFSLVLFHVFLCIPRQSPYSRFGSMDLSLTRSCFLDHLRNLESRSLVELEQAAFSRLIQGYRPASVSDLKKAFRSGVRPINHTWLAVCDRLSKIDSKSRPLTRLLEHERHLNDSLDGDILTRLVYHILQTIVAICFAIDYDNLTSQEKNNFVIDACKDLEKNKLRKATKVKQQEIHHNFRTRHRKEVTFRNNIYKLYQTFGVAVLLDPTLDSRAKTTGSPSHSASFPATLTLLLDADVNLVEVHKDNYTFFVNLVRVLADESYPSRRFRTQPWLKNLKS
ncbi:hypothetical protein EDD85DRAFT_793035 [Armillaria nabsnona]|nr:hypothetical protein EDD85DRAFT_793035 [Armillaria nabsnona]